MLRIGDFSRLARVTIKTLHHYDEAGLLRPAHVDAQTGYRYYEAAQLQPLQRILLLKDLGFALDEIRALLSAQHDDPLLLQRLEKRRAELSASIAEDQQRLRRLDALRTCASERSVDAGQGVVLQEIPAVEIYSIRERVARMSDVVPSMFEAAEAIVAKHRTRADASPFLMLHDPEYREYDVDAEVCIPVKAHDAKLGTHLLAGAPKAGCITYRGAYEQTPRLYASMLQWLENSGLRIAGPLREVYHRFGADQLGYSLPSHVLASSSAEYVTELQTPVVEHI
jgi:DNA-binding transcriptional MerR regulator